MTRQPDKPTPPIRIVPLRESLGDLPLSTAKLLSLVPQENPFRNHEAEWVDSKATIEEMASRCNLSTTSFKRKFGKEYGTSPHRWLIHQRVLRSSEMLLSTNLLVKQIAYECGFATPSHFIRCFKREFGCTPEQYRAEYL